MRAIACSIMFVVLVASPAAHAGPLQDAYDAGYLAGVGAPQLVWGSAMGVGGAVLLTSSQNDARTGGLGDLGAAIGRVFGVALTAVGAAQLIPGAVLVGLGHPDKPETSRIALRAYDAGYDVGVGGTLVGYGSATAVVSIATGAAIADERNQDGAWVPAVSGGLAAVQIALGIWRLMEGLAERDRLRTAGMADGPESHPMELYRDP